MKNVAIVGYGSLGRSLGALFPGAVPYDEPEGIGSRDAVNQCDFAYVCVPTPSRQDGRCDTSIVEQVVSWIGCPSIVIGSTVEVGTTRRLKSSTGKHIVFQPMYGPGETPDHPFRQLRDARWIILGGDRADTVPVSDLYKNVFNASVVIQQTTPETAEMTKYMENAFLATKVAFCNEMYDISTKFGVDYNELRELWLLDPRINRSHTFVIPDKRGFGGKCLPKDISALVTAANDVQGYLPVLLQSVLASNARVRQSSQPSVDGNATIPGILGVANGREHAVDEVLSQ